MAFVESDAISDRATELARTDAVAARAAALSVPNDSVGTEQANQVTRALANQLGRDPHRLAICAAACHHHSKTHSGRDPIWQRAERLAWNALTLVEALQ